jgi:hypothetical protein
LSGLAANQASNDSMRMSVSAKAIRRMLDALD